MKKYKVDDKFLNDLMNTYYTKKVKLKKNDLQWDEAFDCPKSVPSSYDMLKKCQKEAEELRAKLQEAQEEILMLKEEVKDLNNLLDQV
jgi:predicted  nucleic acid-binding Zn-ribbon protein